VGDQGEHLALPCGERGQPFGFVRRGRRAADEVVDESSGDAGSGDGLAGRDGADGGEEVVGERVLE
jgi:hypothetical protein